MWDISCTISPSSIPDRNAPPDTVMRKPPPCLGIVYPMIGSRGSTAISMPSPTSKPASRIQRPDSCNALVVRLLDPVVRRVPPLPPVVQERGRGVRPDVGDVEAVVRVRVPPLVLQHAPRDPRAEEGVHPQALRAPAGPEHDDRGHDVPCAH